MDIILTEHLINHAAGAVGEKRLEQLELFKLLARQYRQVPGPVHQQLLVRRNQTLVGPFHQRAICHCAEQYDAGQFEAHE
ncbi:hypothetical protein D3C80_2131570 [compost metagenome]